MYISYVFGRSRYVCYHHASAQPPKIRTRACLELHDVEFARLADEAVWGCLWFAMTNDSGARGSKAILHASTMKCLWPNPYFMRCRSLPCLPFTPNFARVSANIISLNCRGEELKSALRYEKPMPLKS